MADFQAIGGVSATLQTLLADRMELPEVVNTAPPVTTGPPPFSSKDVDPHKEDPRVNLFLYRVTENGYLQNQEIPGRGTPSAFGHPPLSLNLHYLVTAYGNEDKTNNPGMFDDTIAQFLLGSAMRVLHDVPIVTENLRTVRPVSGRMVLHESLRQEFEHVKLTLEPLTLEDVTKVWTALSLRYRLSAAYVVTVVQIESRRPRRFPQPVGQPISATIPPLPSDPPSPGPMVYAPTIQTPTIADLKVRRAGTNIEQPFPYANVGDTLVLRGTSLAGPVTNVAIGDVVVPASLARGDRVEALIPDAVIPGVGPIPAGQQLQPGVRTARVIVSDPLVPGSVFTSNDAAFMLVPFVDPLTLGYTAAPTRRLTVNGSRLLGPSPGGETLIGRSAVPRVDYITATPTQVVVPIPDTLPARGVHVLIGGPLGDPVQLSGLAPTLTITIDNVTKPVTATFPTPVTSSIARSEVAAVLAGLIHDAGAAATPPDSRFTGARVDLWRDQVGDYRLVVVPGGLMDTIAISSPPGLLFATDLGFVPPPPGPIEAYVSGALPSPPPLTSPNPRVTLTMGGQPPITVVLAKPTSLAALAADLQTQINAAGGAAAYTGALVATTGAQLLVVPGAPGPVTFTAAPGDSTTVGELQLHASFAVRVRVNGAESIDKPPVNAVVELPQ